MSWLAYPVHIFDVKHVVVCRYLQFDSGWSMFLICYAIAMHRQCKLLSKVNSWNRNTWICIFDKSATGDQRWFACPFTQGSDSVFSSLLTIYSVFIHQSHRGIGGLWKDETSQCRLSLIVVWGGPHLSKMIIIHEVSRNLLADGIIIRRFLSNDFKLTELDIPSYWCIRFRV